MLSDTGLAGMGMTREKYALAHPNDWTSEDRLRIIKALIVLGPENEGWDLVKERVMFLCDMPAQFLEENRDKYTKAIEFAKAEVSIEV